MPEVLYQQYVELALKEALFFKKTNQKNALVSPRLDGRGTQQQPFKVTITLVMDLGAWREREELEVTQGSLEGSKWDLHMALLAGILALRIGWIGLRQLEHLAMVTSTDCRKDALGVMSAFKGDGGEELRFVTNSI